MALRANSEGAARRPSLPGPVMAVMARLWEGGQAAYAVGGGLRDALLGRAPADWDVATDAPPARILELFPGGRYQNRFGTVTVPAGDERVEVTTFRRDHLYGDHRRPDQVTFTDSLAEDLRRRDFTVNALAYGRAADGAGPALEDPEGGLVDLAARSLRAVGDPFARFDEDALRLVRAVRLAAQLDFTIEPATLTALRRLAPHVRHVSAERVGQELRKLLAATPPSRGLRLLETSGLLEHLFPLLAAQRGVPQAKIPGDDLWTHTLRTVDAAAELAPGDGTVLLAALLHDVGKPETHAEGHFLGHETVGARRTAAFLRRLAVPGREAEPVVQLVRWHMFAYLPTWHDAAVRRLMRRVGAERLPQLFQLREADNVGSGCAAGHGDLDELRARVAQQLARHVPLTLRDLAVDGRDLQAELGLAPGPELGRLLDRLLASIIADPARNTRQRLLADARAWLARTPGSPSGGAAAGEALARGDAER